MNRFLCLPAAVAVLALGAAGCGDDDKDSALSTAEYIAQADRLCKPAPQTPRTEDPRVVARFYRQQLIPFRKRTVANLRKLEPNADLRPKVEAFLRESERINGLFEQQAAALARNDLIRSGNLDVAIAQGQARRNKAAAQVGYRKCGQPTQGPPVTAAGFESAAVLVPADAACKRATDRIVATKPRNFEPPTLAATIVETLPEQRRALGVLLGLRSRATKPGYVQFVRIEQQRFVQARRIVAAGRANNQALFDRLQEQDGQLYGRGQPIALRLGFTVCGVSSPVGF